MLQTLGVDQGGLLLIDKRTAMGPKVLVVALVSLVCCVAVGWLLASAPSADAHANDRCTWETSVRYPDGYWACVFDYPKQPTGTRHWFQAANPKRNWKRGGSMAQGHPNARVCVGIKRASNGDRAHFSCDAGWTEGFTGAAWRPGWIYNRHNGNGKITTLNSGFSWPDGTN